MNANWCRRASSGPLTCRPISSPAVSTIRVRDGNVRHSFRKYDIINKEIHKNGSVFKRIGKEGSIVGAAASVFAAGGRFAQCWCFWRHHIRQSLFSL